MKIMASIAGARRQYELQPSPDKCPVCHKAVLPTVLETFTKDASTRPEKLPEISAVLQCPSMDCLAIFIVRAIIDDVAIVFEIFPKTAPKSGFSRRINKVSPKFVEIFDQSCAAEAAGLNQLFGMGLRKGLEFLVKDYLIAQLPDQEATIRKKLLGNCIKDHIDDQNIAQIAERAVWLGNDETHYERRWENQNIEDLKCLISLTVNAIDNALLTKEYLDSMP